jgi:hypothetical protein
MVANLMVAVPTVAGPMDADLTDVNRMVDLMVDASLTAAAVTGLHLTPLPSLNQSLEFKLNV